MALGDTLRAENERLVALIEGAPKLSGGYVEVPAGIVTRLQTHVTRLTAALAQHRAQLREIRGMAQAGPSGIRGDIIARVDAALSDPDGTVAVERWRKLEAVLETGQRLLRLSCRGVALDSDDWGPFARAVRDCEEG